MSKKKSKKMTPAMMAAAGAGPIAALDPVRQAEIIATNADKKMAGLPPITIPSGQLPAAPAPAPQAAPAPLLSVPAKKRKAHKDALGLERLSRRTPEAVQARLQQLVEGLHSGRWNPRHQKIAIEQIRLYVLIQHVLALGLKPDYAGKKKAKKQAAESIEWTINEILGRIGVGPQKAAS